MTAALNDAEIAHRLDAAEQIARRAGELALSFFLARDRLKISHKAAQDRVTEADRGVETLIRDAIIAEFPDDALMGEEHGDRQGRSPYLWVIDPIDGTTPFLAGLADWCVSIAVAVEGEPVIGVIDAPRHRETWVAARGRGATVNGTTIRVEPDADLTSGMFALAAACAATPPRRAAL
jgi:myo-inositol-1(or 4)-monophosphatase